MRCLTVIVALLPLVSVAQSIQVAEMAADRCMYEEALGFLEKAPKPDARSRRGLLLRARLLIQLDRGDAAVAVLSGIDRSARRIDESERLLALGLALSSAKRLDDAESALKQARDAGGDADVVDGALAAILIQRNKLDEAEVLLRAVLMRSPLLSGALYNLAVVDSRRGRIAESAALLRQAWHAGLRDPDQLKKDPDLAAVIQKKGLVDDLLASTIPRCRTY